MPVLLWFGAIFELPKSLERLAQFWVIFPILSCGTLSVAAEIFWATSFALRLHLPSGIVAAVFVMGIIPFAWFLSHRFDAPVRRWLSAKARVRATAMPSDHRDFGVMQLRGLCD